MGRRSRLLVLALAVPLLVAAGAIAYPRLFPGEQQLDEWMCTDTMSTGPSFCRTVITPGFDQSGSKREVDAAKISQLAKANGIVLEPVPMTWGDLWVERGVPADVRRLLAGSLDGDLSQVTGDLRRQFQRRPKIVAFSSAVSFERGLRTLFGLDEPTARTLSRNAGGALLTEVRTVAVNWGQLSREVPLTILRHELAHAILRDIAGDSVILPAWFDEGVATLQQNTAYDSGPKVVDQLYSANTLVASGRARLSGLASSRDWIRETAALEGRTYAVAFAAVQILHDRIGTPGLSKIVSRTPEVGFETAFREAAGMDPATFERQLPAMVAALAPPPALGVTRVSAQELEWRVRGFPPNGSARATITGPNGYRIEFEVKLDAGGEYRARFGSNVPAGSYALVVTSGSLDLRGELVVGR